MAAELILMLAELLAVDEEERLPGRCNWNTRNQLGRSNRENGTTF